MCINFNPPLTETPHESFEKYRPKGFRGEVVQMRERTGGRRTGSDHNSSS